MNKAAISVIIPVYNEEKVIKQCLSSILNQSIDAADIITVDDGSTDRTIEILKEFASGHPMLKVLNQDHRGPGAARNLGSSYAQGDILVFVDADMTFDRRFLEKLTYPITSGNTKGTFSKEEYVSNWENAFARSWNINEGWEVKRRHGKNYPDRQKVFRAILKKEFDRIGGFIPGGYTDDDSLSQKLGYEAIAAPGAIFYHANPETLSEIFIQAGWAAKREYKLGRPGIFFALIRASFPLSLILGLYKSILYREPIFLIFKIVYDAGTIFGLTQYIITGRASK